MEILFFVALVVLFVIIVAILVVSIVFTYFTVSSGFMHSSPPVPSCGKVKDAMLKGNVTSINAFNMKEKPAMIQSL